MSLTQERSVVEHVVPSQVFKILVRKGPDESWVVFRRYTDFSRLNDKVRFLSVCLCVVDKTCDREGRKTGWSEKKLSVVFHNSSRLAPG